MQILRVELENIKSYERASIPFTEGVNAIVGHNGAGKSTILEAIGFVLFDSILYKASDFLREGARTGSIAVTFASSYDERTYRVERRFGGSHLYVVYDPELKAKLCEGKVDVLAFVRRHTGADPATDLSRLFGDAIGVAQGTLTAIFQQTPAVRKSTFDVLLQVEEYKQAFDRLLEPRNLLIERQRELAQQVAVLESRLERIPLLEGAIGARAAEITETQRGLTALSQRLAFVKTRKAALDELQAQIDAFGLRQATLHEREQTLATTVAAAQRALEEAQHAVQVVDANRDGHAQYVAAQTERQVLEQRVQQRQALLAQRAAADKTVAVSTTTLAQLDTALAEVALAEQSVVALVPAVAEQHARTRELAEAQLAVQQLAELDKQIAQQQRQVGLLEEQHRKLAAQAEKASETKAALEQVEEESSRLREVLTGRNGELATCQAAAEEIKKQNQALEAVDTAQCPVCEQPLTPEHRTRMLARNQAQLQELRRQYADIQANARQAESVIKDATDRQKRLLGELANMPRPAELDDLRQRMQEVAQTLAGNATLHASLATAPQRADALAAALAALGNPQQQSAVAAQQAARRPVLGAQLAKVHGQRAEAQRQFAAVEKLLAEYEPLDAAVAATNATLAAHEVAYQTVLRYHQMANSVEARQQAVEHEQAALAQTKAEGLEVERSAAGVRAQLDPVEYSGILSEDQVLRGEEGRLAARNELLQQEQAREQAELTALRRHQADLAALQEQKGSLATQITVLDAVRSLLRQSGPYITQALVRQISASAATVYGELMQDFGRELRWNDDYGITLEGDGVARQFAQLSGGEQMSAALAVRLALVREMSNIDIAFFDEPTANLDDVRREALARQIMNVKGFRQLFVISHDDTFEQVTQNLVRVKRHGNTSIVADANAN